MIKHIIDLQCKIERYALEENWNHPFGMLADFCGLRGQDQKVLFCLLF